MSFQPVYYTGYEINDDEELSDVQSESSGDEVEKDVCKFLNQNKSKHKIRRISLNKSDLADDFENEMQKELDNMVEKEKEKYFPSPKDENKPIKMLNNQDINYAIEDTDSEEEMETGVRSKMKKPVFTNDDLLYDPDMDEDDQDWINKKRKTSKKIVSPKQPVTTFSSTEEQKPIPDVTYVPPNSDAVLNCPCCMEMLCMDCQRHETINTQYRAMFVFSCKIDETELLKYPKYEENKKKFKKLKKKNKKKESDENTDMITESVAASTTSIDYDIYRPVACNNCNTSVGV